MEAPPAKAFGAARIVALLLIALAVAALAYVRVAPGDGRVSVLLGVESIALSIGLGVYSAWVHSAWSSRRKTAGLAAALAGAVIGGALGFGVTAGLLAVITTIAGATIGANLILLMLVFSGAGLMPRSR